MNQSILSSQAGSVTNSAASAPTNVAATATAKQSKGLGIGKLGSAAARRIRK